MADSRHQAQLFRHDLPIGQDICTPFEFDPHNGESNGGGGPHATYTGRAVHRRLNRKRYKRLHFRGSHAVGFGQNGHRGRGKVGEHVHGHRLRNEQPCGHECQRQQHHQDAIVQREMNESCQHEARLLVGMTVGGNRARKRRQTNVVGSFHGNAITGHEPAPDFHLIGVADADFDTPSLERLTAALEIYHDLTTFIGHGVFGYRQRRLLAIGFDQQVREHADAQCSVAIGHFVTDWNCACFLVDDSADVDQASTTTQDGHNLIWEGCQSVACAGARWTRARSYSETFASIHNVSRLITWKSWRLLSMSSPDVTLTATIVPAIGLRSVTRISPRRSPTSPDAVRLPSTLVSRAPHPRRAATLGGGHPAPPESTARRVPPLASPCRR